MNFKGLLSYKTIKVIKVNDWRLGALHYFFQTAIGIYVLLMVVVEKRYLIFDAPIGATRINLEEPEDLSLNTTKLEYCKAVPAEDVFGCLIWDGMDIRYPLVEEGAIFLTTRVNIHEEKIVCLPTDTTCEGEKWEDVGKEKYFIPEVEKYGLQIRHSVSAPQIVIHNPGNPHYEGTSINMEGKLLVGKDEEEEDIDTIKGEDFILISKLLSSTPHQVSLDDHDDPLESNRYSGVVLNFVISYDNNYPFFLPTGDIKYTYRVHHINGATFKGLQTVHHNGTHRTTYSRRGIRVLFQQTGTIGKGDFQTLLIQIIAGLALTKVASVIVDLIAMWIFPSHDKLKDLKYETIEFEDGNSENEMKDSREQQES